MSTLSQVHFVHIFLSSFNPPLRVGGQLLESTHQNNSFSQHVQLANTEV